MQKARKDAGLNVDDRIKLSLVSAEPAVQESIQTWGDTIQAEVLATELTDTKLSAASYTVEAKVNKLPVTISLIKA